MKKEWVKIRYTLDLLRVHVHVSLVFSESHYSIPSCDRLGHHGGYKNRQLNLQ